jgi:carboxyl-terminal processing protease
VIGFKGLSFVDFVSKMNASNLYFNQFQKKNYQNGIRAKFDRQAIGKTLSHAEFARQLYGENYYYEIVPKEDAMIKEVLRLRNRSSKYN